MTSYYGSSKDSHPHGGTPQYLIDRLSEEYGELYDPCPNNFEVDGLSIDWPLNQTAFVNPPYTRGEISKWAEKCFEQYQRGVQVIMLIPSYTDVKYFHKFIYNTARLEFIEGRLKFKMYNSRASFPSMLCYFENVEMIQ